ncbi:MAG: hypothetical protein AVDCRST_MAG67-3912, partial [uncultured Solirubrobacteraceae bacterium]
WPCPTTPSLASRRPARPAAVPGTSSRTSAGRRSRSPARGATAAGCSCPATTPRPRAAPPTRR